ncbi:bifunctional DNA-formamidopyrimidine glycosylase/DNA-(apurinic or apyrimidinic site) lyase [Succinimonas amylolytica]|uniref:bifunctional DNA-formamidopyrimidine glycosylase/DNA-(apurinic or apyrimidinic site) lyase n=1 Tax=Succinimonas amylolytica TaxID=83769 RepID=UPI0003808A3B|nr:bifunctional DNA-formamidopyrimidine glycosylase/DNA-(apurinic or apyrimidinic site) lyase [Succinimonas amylolytica]
MPELPEVEVTRRGIAPALVNKCISHFVVRFPCLRTPVSPEFSTLENLSVVSVNRRGKYIIIKTDSGSVLIHLGMSGHLHLVSPDTPVIKHDHIDIVITGGQVIRFNDQRRFGLFEWFSKEKDPYADPRLSKLGPEPLEASFTGQVLYERIHRFKTPVKKILMDNEVLVGVGNIYASEVLFASRVSPMRRACDVTDDECEILVKNIRQILEASISRGGTTIHDFSGSDGNPGKYVSELKVYGRKGEPCPVCGTPIEHAIIGRSAYYCPVCQKAPKT